jgi:hypothetical protein
MPQCMAATHPAAPVSVRGASRTHCPARGMGHAGPRGAPRAHATGADGHGGQPGSGGGRACSHCASTRRFLRSMSNSSFRPGRCTLTTTRWPSRRARCTWPRLAAAMGVRSNLRAAAPGPVGPGGLAPPPQHHPAPAAVPAPQLAPACHAPARRAQRTAEREEPQAHPFCWSVMLWREADQARKNNNNKNTSRRTELFRTLPGAPGQGARRGPGAHSS